MAKVVAVNVSLNKGTIKKPVNKINVNEKGIEGDAHAGYWHRQVSLLGRERINDFSKKMGRELDHGEFAENITTLGINLSNVCLFDKFKINDVELEVTQIGKECHGSGCQIFRQVGKCIMPHEGIFARVLNGGEIKTNDDITYTPETLKAAFITLSDRASKGIYKDESGPICESLFKEFFKDKPYRFATEKIILPDDEKLVEESVKNLINSRTNIIFTTGSTGIGPRDIAYEAIHPLLQKDLSTLMEHVKIKYGSKKPQALVSRAIAGVSAETFIYSMPGSPKAVKEYMAEILPTIEHSLNMLKGINKHG